MPTKSSKTRAARGVVHATRPVFDSLQLHLALEKRMPWVIKQRAKRVPWLEIQQQLADEGVDVSVRSLQRYVKKASAD